MKTYLFVIGIITLMFVNFSALKSQINTTFKNGISLENNANIIDTSNIQCWNKLLVEKINVDNFKNLIRNSNKKLNAVIIWGSWCPTTVLGLTSIKDLLKYENLVNFIIISVDICSMQQIDYVKKILCSNKIDLTTYIVDNNFYNDIKEFAKLEHVYSFIKSFDVQYKKIQIYDPINGLVNLSPIPYFSIIDRNGEILYRKIPEISTNPKTTLSSDFFNLDYDEIIKIFNNK